MGHPRSLAIAVLTVAAAAGCDRGRADPVSTPPVSAVEVPAAPPESERSTINRRSDHSSPPGEVENLENVEEDGLALEEDDATVVHFSSVFDAGVRFWGSFTRRDGGLRFQGGFSTGSAGTDGGAP
jgi:hypothetical protein